MRTHFPVLHELGNMDDPIGWIQQGHIRSENQHRVIHLVASSRLPVQFHLRPSNVEINLSIWSYMPAVGVMEIDRSQTQYSLLVLEDSRLA